VPAQVETVASLRAALGQWRRQNLKIALVPTMGALHEGHLSLVRFARQFADRVCVSIFVNPKQFGPAEDFSRYPRDLAGDAALLDGVGADLLYLPNSAEIYPSGFATTVSVAGVSAGLCGDRRPGHFAGVATVVAKLLIQAAPDVAVFGEKDYQQLQVIKRMAADLDLPAQILGAPIWREADGLAMSSRNRYLTPAERAIAPALYQVIKDVAAALANGGSVAALLAEGRARLTAAGFTQLDYLEVRDAATLAPVESLSRPARVFVAAFLGATRLIDNVPVDKR
jgi:pantoate--beta-alanine ligase